MLVQFTTVALRLCYWCGIAANWVLIGSRGIYCAKLYYHSYGHAELPDIEYMEYNVNCTHGTSFDDQTLILPFSLHLAERNIDFDFFLG